MNAYCPLSVSHNFFVTIIKVISNPGSIPACKRSVIRDLCNFLYPLKRLFVFSFYFRSLSSLNYNFQVLIATCISICHTAAIIEFHFNSYQRPRFHTSARKLKHESSTAGKATTMASIIGLFYPTFTDRGKTTAAALGFFTITVAIIFLASWRVIWGRFFYYTEYYLASRGESDIGGKCIYILRELNFWKRVQHSKDWWWRMRCEGNLAGSLSQEKYLHFDINPRVSPKLGKI